MNYIDLHTNVLEFGNNCTFVAEKLAQSFIASFDPEVPVFENTV
jgi:hypothetical protein